MYYGTFAAAVRRSRHLTVGVPWIHEGQANPRAQEVSGPQSARPTPSGRTLQSRCRWSSLRSDPYLLRARPTLNRAPTRNADPRHERVHLRKAPTLFYVIALYAIWIIEEEANGVVPVNRRHKVGE